MTKDDLNTYHFLLHKGYLEMVLENLWKNNKNNEILTLFNSDMSELVRNNYVSEQEKAIERRRIINSLTKVLNLDFYDINYGGYFEQKIINEIETNKLDEKIRNEKRAIEALIKRKQEIEDEFKNKKRKIFILESEKRQIETGRIMVEANYSYVDKNLSIINFYP